MELGDYRRTHHVPAFGSWDYEDNLPFTECFESARQAMNAGLLPYDYAEEQEEDRDLYVAGDLYQNDVVTPAVIVVPRRNRKKKGGQPQPPHVRESIKQQQGLYEWGYGYDIKDSPSPIRQQPPIAPPPKPIDEDLYKISPDLLYSKPKKKRSGLGFFSSCLLPACA